VYAETKAKAIKKATQKGYPTYMPDNEYARKRSLQDIKDQFGQEAVDYIRSQSTWSNEDQKYYSNKDLKLTDVGFSVGLVPMESTFRKQTYDDSRETTRMGNMMTMADGGGIGFIPMNLEEDLRIIAKWGGTDIKGVIGILNAMIDSGVTNEDLIPKPTKNTPFQIEKATEKKIQEIWNRIKPNYKGDFKGNMYYSTLKEMIRRNSIYKDVLTKFKPFRKYQKDSFADGGFLDKYEVDRFKQVMNGKAIAKYIVRLQDSFGNKETYVFGIKIKDQFKGCELVPYESLYGGWSNSGIAFSLDNLQVEKLVPNSFSNIELDEQETEMLVNKLVENNQAGVEKFLNSKFFYLNYNQTFKDVLRGHLALSVARVSSIEFEIVQKFADGGGIEDDYKGTIIDDSISYIVKKLPYNYQIEDNSLGLSVYGQKEALISLKNLLHFKYGIDSEFYGVDTIGLKELKIPSGQIVNSYAKGGSLPSQYYYGMGTPYKRLTEEEKESLRFNNYNFKSAKQVWGAWTVEQQQHFLKDHIENNVKHQNYIKKEGDNLMFKAFRKYEDLPTVIKAELIEHIKKGQYAKGGFVKEEMYVLVKPYQNGSDDFYFSYAEKEPNGYVNFPFSGYEKSKPALFTREEAEKELDYKNRTERGIPAIILPFGKKAELSDFTNLKARNNDYEYSPFSTNDTKYDSSLLSDYFIDGGFMNNVYAKGGSLKKDWWQTVVNPNEDFNNYDDKKPIDWEVDDFKSWVVSNSDIDGNVDKEVLEVIKMPKSKLTVEYLNKNGSGKNNNEYYKKYGNWQSALYDIFTQLKKDYLFKKERKYILKSDIKTVTVKRKGKEVTYNGSDVLNGAYVLAKGGDITSKANYVGKNDIVEVELKDGSKVKPANGYWVKKGAEPVGTQLTPTSSGKSETKVGETYIRKDMRGNWKAETNVDNFNDYDWRISTIKTYSGNLISSAQGGKTESTGTKGIVMFKYTMYEDPNYTLEVSKPSRLTEKVVTEQHEKALAKFKKFMQTGNFGKGGKISKFDKLSAKVAKQYEGKPVKSQFQEEYGKYYSKEEAKEVGDKVAGKVKAMQSAKK